MKQKEESSYLSLCSPPTSQSATSARHWLSLIRKEGSLGNAAVCRQRTYRKGRCSICTRYMSFLLNSVYPALDACPHQVLNKCLLNC